MSRPARTDDDHKGLEVTSPGAGEAARPRGAGGPARILDRRARRGLPEALRVCATAPNLRRTATIALVVGVCLVLINQLKPLVSGPRTVGVWVRVVLDFVVPFVVSNLGVLSASRRQRP